MHLKHTHTHTHTHPTQKVLWTIHLYLFYSKVHLTWEIYELLSFNSTEGQQCYLKEIVHFVLRIKGFIPWEIKEFVPSGLLNPVLTMWLSSN